MSSPLPPEEDSWWPRSAELAIDTLGPCRHSSPIRGHQEPFVDDRTRILLCSDTAQLEAMARSGASPAGFEAAGPRRKIYFDPARLTCGIITCGGLCPGLNNVIRSVVLRLTYAYGVRRILGFRYGYAGLAASHGLEPVSLTPAGIENIHERGGTLLGTSRGPQDVKKMVQTLSRWNVGILFVIGGDGGLRGASALGKEVARQRQEIGIIGIPKTIDNDLMWVTKTFGFDTAVEAARSALLAAHVEARGIWDGVGLVKLMGRQSGFIAAHATLASSDVNFCLVPEVPLVLEGEGGFLKILERRLADRHHAVIVVAEGAGQDLIHDGAAPAKDASGNPKLKDIGLFLRRRIARFLGCRDGSVPMRYIDPGYMIRSLPANSMDAELCSILGQHAVHAGMAGRTGMLVGMWNHRPTHVPIALATRRQRRLDPRGEVWQRVLETTGQPFGWGARAIARGPSVSTMRQGPLS
ncbi:MAG: ATP-dependent 6-phosphofructokinase [Acidobacteriota bacterium]